MLRTTLFSVLIGVLLMTAVPVVGAETSLLQIVPPQCESCPCGFGGVLEIIRRVMNLAIVAAGIIATFTIIYAGFLFIASAANPESRKKASSMLLGAAIGLVLVLGAWLIIDAFMRFFYSGPNGNEGVWGPWNSIVAEEGEWCVVAKPQNSLFENLKIGQIPQTVETGPPPNPNPVSGTKGCPSCVSLSSRGISCKIASSCTLDSSVVDRVVALKNGFSGDWTVTEAYPPTVTHTNKCHANGTCIDVGFRGATTYTAANITTFGSAVRKAGLRPVFETPDCKLRNVARASGMNAYCSTDRGYSHITGSHFSVYAN